MVTLMSLRNYNIVHSISKLAMRNVHSRILYGIHIRTLLVKFKKMSACLDPRALTVKTPYCNSAFDGTVLNFSPLTRSNKMLSYFNYETLR
jgi:hypothetical protein